MIQISLSKTEPSKLIQLMEEMFPEVKLDPIKTILDGLVLNTSDLSFSKKLKSGDTITIDLKIV